MFTSSVHVIIKQLLMENSCSLPVHAVLRLHLILSSLLDFIHTTLELCLFQITSCLRPEGPNLCPRYLINGRFHLQGQWPGLFANWLCACPLTFYCGTFWAMAVFFTLRTFLCVCGFLFFCFFVLWRSSVKVCAVLSVWLVSRLVCFLCVCVFVCLFVCSFFFFLSWCWFLNILSLIIRAGSWYSVSRYHSNQACAGHLRGATQMESRQGFL